MLSSLFMSLVDAKHCCAQMIPGRFCGHVCSCCHIHLSGTEIHVGLQNLRCNYRLLFALVLSNLSIIPTACTLYDDIIWGFAVPMGIPLLMLQCNMKMIWKETDGFMIIFCIVLPELVAGAFLAYALLHNFIPGLAGVAAIMTGSYIGGGVTLQLWHRI